MRAGIAGGLCVLLMTAGCGDSGPYIDERDGVRLVAAGKSSFSRAALVSGEVTLTQGRCVGLLQGKSTMLVVWMHGTRLKDDGSGIRLPGVGDVRFGESISGGGGYVGSAHLVANPPGVEIPSECLKGVDEEAAFLESEARRGD